MEVFVEDVLKFFDGEIQSITSDILSVTYPVENVKMARAKRDQLIVIRNKIVKIYEKHCDTERGFKW